jgi:hypothetical protein
VYTIYVTSEAVDFANKAINTYAGDYGIAAAKIVNETTESVTAVVAGIAIFCLVTWLMKIVHFWKQLYDFVHVLRKMGKLRLN